MFYLSVHFYSFEGGGFVCIFSEGDIQRCRRTIGLRQLTHTHIYSLRLDWEMEGKQIILILRNLENAGFEKKHTVLRIVFSSDLFTHRLLCPSPGKALECICIALLGFDGRWLSVNVVISIRGTRLDQNKVQKKSIYQRLLCYCHYNHSLNTYK